MTEVTKVHQIVADWKKLETEHEKEAYWKDIFGFSRPDEDGVRQPKGIIKIKF